MMDKIKSTENGFHITFANGWTVSVAFDPKRNYCNRDGSNAEVAAFYDSKDGTTYWKKLGRHDAVLGYQSPDEGPHPGSGGEVEAPLDDS